MKRILLMSLLIIVVLGFSASALDLKFKPMLTVELEVDPGKVIDTPGFWGFPTSGTFWVDVYLTPLLKETIENTNIMLRTSSGDLYFTGEVEQGDIFGVNVQAKVNPQPSGSVLSLSSTGKFMALQGKRKMARVAMAAKQPGTYKIELLKDEEYPLQKSYAQYQPQDDQNYYLYTLSMSPVNVCLPVTKCPNAFDCGYKDNGCGKVLTCNPCDQPKYCVDNVCTDLVVVSPDPNDINLCKSVLATNSNEKTLLEKIASALKQYKDYKTEFSEIAKALVEWFEAAKQPQP